MADLDTLTEGENGLEVAPTTRRRLPTTILEPGPDDAPNAAAPLAPGSVFRQHRVISHLPVTSGEADLWLVEPTQGGPRRVLKHYRYGVRPKMEILEQIARLHPDHVVGVLDHGEVDGRCFEIQEYIPHGTLAEFVEAGRPDATAVRAILVQIADALVHLQSFKVLHRDLKPSNLLLRSRDPLDLVLTDFGISSVSDFSIHLTSVSRTAAYCAPEAVSGVVSRASDWWSVGVILLELLAGQHPFAGLTEQAINLQLTSRGIPVPADLGADWQLLLCGLLTRDYHHRWGADEVRRWLAGERNIPVLAGAPSDPALIAPRPYRFGGQDYSDPAGLAEGLVMNWPEAAKHLALGYVLRWVEHDLKDQQLATRLREIQADPALVADHQLPVVLLALHAGLPLAVRGVILDEAVCGSSPEFAAALAGSSLGRWLNRLRREPWLEQWSADYRATRAEVMGSGVPLQDDALPALLRTPRAALDEAVADRRSRFPGSRHPKLAALLNQETLTRAEAVILLAARPDLFLSPADLEMERLLDRVRHRGWRIEEDLARRLLRRPEWSALAPSWQILRRHWEERVRTPLPPAHPDLAEILDQSSPEPFDAIAALANRLEFENSLQMRFVPIPGTRLLASRWPTRVRDYRSALPELGRVLRSPHFDQTPDHPVVWVSHSDAEAFCKWLTARERAQGLIGPKDVYRLPTDLEWSRMAGLEKELGHSPRERNGRIEGIYPWGTAWPPPAHAGNTGYGPARDPNVGTVPVGTYPPNELGLFDLGTQVMEWCGDRYDDETDLFVVRGGSWCHSTPENFVLSVRRRFVDRQASENLGFRCVLEFRPLPPPPPPEPPPPGPSTTPEPPKPTASFPMPGPRPRLPQAKADPPRRPFWRMF